MKKIVLLMAVWGVLKSEAQEYKALHAKAIVVDTHNDVLTTATLEGLDVGKDLRGRTHSDLARLKAGGVDVQVFSICSKPRPLLSVIWC